MGIDYTKFIGVYIKCTGKTEKAEKIVRAICRDCNNETRTDKEIFCQSCGKKMDVLTQYYYKIPNEIFEFEEKFYHIASPVNPMCEIPDNDGETFVRYYHSNGFNEKTAIVVESDPSFQNVVFGTHEIDRMLIEARIEFDEVREMLEKSGFFDTVELEFGLMAYAW
jgi:hypothetical protein